MLCWKIDISQGGELLRWREAWKAFDNFDALESESVLLHSPLLHLFKLFIDALIVIDCDEDDANADDHLCNIFSNSS